MASWRNHYSRGWDNSGWNGYDRSRGWNENESQSWGRTINNEGDGQWEDWGDSQEQNDWNNQEDRSRGWNSGVRNDSNPHSNRVENDAERQGMQDSYDPLNIEETAIQAPIAPQSRPIATSEPMESPIGSTSNSYYTGVLGSTQLVQPLDISHHEELRVAYLEDNVEVAGTSSTNPTAVAETPIEIMVHPVLEVERSKVRFDLAYFQHFQPFTSGYKQHNVALKWFRLLAERSGLNFINFDMHGTVAVPVCDHPLGMSYSFDETSTKEWNWREMVAQMNDVSMKRVVEGPNAAVAEGSNAAVAEGIPKCLVGCAIIKTDRYDHKRSAALKDNKTVYHIWDFVFFRNDGSQIGCHPEYSKTKFGSYEGQAQTDHELPKGGKGGSSGPGTYKYMKEKGNHQPLGFDARKREPRVCNLLMLSR